MKQIFGHRQTFLNYYLLLAALIWSSACNETQITPVATQVSVVAEDTAVPTPTTAPSDTPVPSATNTPPPTLTLTPTATDTATAVPTDTPTTTSTTTPNPSATATNPPFPTNTPLPPATPTVSVPSVTLGSLAESMGQEVTVSGSVVSVASFSGGFRFRLNDGTGQVTLLMWHDVYDNCWDAPQLNRGATVEATGEIGLFEGELQIVPDFGGDVRVTAVGGSLAPDRDIGDLGNHLGELVQINGHINRIETISSGAKLFVTDDTGEILVFVWNNILDRVPDNVALGVPGTQVRVIGTVEEFNSNREVVPALPYDIEVLP